MKEKTYSIGVDIGHSAVRVVLGALDNGGITIIDYDETLYDKDYDALIAGSFKNVENVCKSVNAAITKIANRNNLDFYAISVNFSQDNIFTKKFNEKFNSSSGKMKINDDIIDNFMMQIEAKNHPNEQKTMLHLLPSDFYLDEQILMRKIDGNEGYKFSADFNSVFVPTLPITHYRAGLANIKKTGKNKSNEAMIVNNILFTPIADAMAVLTDDDKENGVILINIGAELTEVAYFYRKALRYAKSFHFGGNDLTNDIASVFKLRNNEAEKVKLACGHRVSSEIEINEVLVLKRKDLEDIKLLEKNVAIVSEWRIREMFEIIYADLKKEGIRTNPTNGIVLTGGGAKLPFIPKYISEKMNCRAVRYGKSTKNIDAVGHFQLGDPKYSTVIGCMLSSLERYDSRVSNLSIKNNFKETPLDPDNKKDNAISRIVKLFKDDNLNQRYNS